MKNTKQYAGRALCAVASAGLMVAWSSAGRADMNAMQHAGGHGGAGHEHAAGHTHTTKLIFSSAPQRIAAGQRVTMTLKIVDDIDGSPIDSFDRVHDKLLHLIVVSQDLTWFNHVHPQYRGKGVFTITTKIPRAGKYKLYADYRPTVRDGEVAQQSFEVGGSNPRPAVAKLVPGKLNKGWFLKTVSSGYEGQPDKLSKPHYQVALMPMPQKMTAGKDVMLHFQVRDAQGKPVSKLQPYLGARGHLVLLSADTKTYLHTHPLDGEHTMGGVKMGAPSGGSDVMFHTNFPQAGLYKGWGQFQHGSKLITAAFVLKVEGAAPRGAEKKAKTAGAVSKATVTIDGGYSPAVVNAKAGQPLKLTFIRKEKYGCGDVIQIPSLGLKRNLKPGESTTVTVTPKKGTMNFTCGMNMYKGSIVAK